MCTLVLSPGHSTLHYALFLDRELRPGPSGALNDYRGPEACRTALLAIQQQCATTEPSVIGLRAPFGGLEFDAPVWVNDQTAHRLETMIPAAPLHIPSLLELLRQCAVVFPATPLILAFDTAFFADLPDREALYALDTKLAHTRGLRRFGHHGLLHAAACRKVSELHGLYPEVPAPRIISICLEPQPELAGVIGLQPVYVTGGVTPLEGLPGHTTCGDLDPGLVVLLSEELHCGPERLNTLFTRESGLLGLTGAPLTFDDLFTAPEEQYALTRHLIRYRLLQACGMAIAALGGLDALVFSGRYLQAGKRLATWLQAQPVFRPAADRVPFSVLQMTQTPEQLMAEIAVTRAWEIRQQSSGAASRTATRKRMGPSASQLDMEKAHSRRAPQHSKASVA